MSFLIVSYFTRNTLYERKSRDLIESLEKFKISYHVEGVANRGSWAANTSYKPTFVKCMMLQFPEQNIVWVDCDAVFHAYPKLFDEIQGDIAAYVYDGRDYPKQNQRRELLSGTVFFRNVSEVLGIVAEWERLCTTQPNIWDQVHLANVLLDNFELLPGEYCKIVNRMRDVENPVIVHHQASRIVRRQGGQLT